MGALRPRHPAADEKRRLRPDACRRQRCCPTAPPAVLRALRSGWRRWLEKLAKKPKTEKTAQQLRQDAEHFRTGAVPGGLDRYLAAVYPEVCTGVDYLPKDAVVFLCESGRVDERVKGTLLQAQAG